MSVVRVALTIDNWFAQIDRSRSVIGSVNSGANKFELTIDCAALYIDSAAASK